ncbi:MAG: diguanylate cyclase [Lachnospiraceae bacterium]|nr:diguanylate cyclase [Lachnospiraceae bacterium]
MKHILMVDDVATNLKCAGEVLKEKYELSMAKSGKQALKVLQETRPDLILLDINMPDMDGYETMAKIKDNPEWADIPVVFLTAEAENESELRSFKMGAMDFIRKPFDPNIMVTRIDRILQIEDMRKELKISAKRDVLTNLWNRQYLEECVNYEGEKTEGAGALVLVDMDNFKAVNDSYGHIAGDRVLKEFSEVLKQYAAEEDIVSRLGGDEFSVFFRGSVDKEELQRRVKAIIETVEERLSVLDGNEINISASIGISIMPEDGMDFMTLYNKADKALYYVKQNGKGNFHIFQDKESYFYYGKNEKDCSVLDVTQLKRIIEEKALLSGAYQVEYDGFKRIYQFVSRCIERNGRDVQIVLFTIVHSNIINMDMGELQESMIHLETAVKTSLRKGDVATKYNNAQYIVILMETTKENGEKVVARIKDMWQDMDDDTSFTLHYDIQGISDDNEDNE